MADKHGPIFAIQLGKKRVLVVSSWELAKECLFKNDNAFANRPKTIAIDHMGYNHAIFGFNPAGPYWRKMRTITANELLSKQGLKTLYRILVSSVTTSIKEIHGKCDEIDMKKWLRDITLDVVFRVVAGKRLREANGSEGGKCMELVERFFVLFQVLMYGDFIPFLRCLDIGGFEKEMEKTGKEMDKVLSRWLEEHKRKRIFCGDKVEQDFMSVLLSIFDGNEKNDLGFDLDTITKATCLALILGGVDSTSVTMIWALRLLVNNPWALKKAQYELDTHVGRKRKVNISDIENLTYLHAIIKETLRLHPPTQLSPPREAITECHVAGYHVPAGTQLYLNLYKIQRDPRVWSDPMEFRPERFVENHKEIDVRGQSFELIPFGSGRRVCVGTTFSLRILHFTLASLLHSFEFANLPGDETSQSCDDDVAMPLQVHLTPRLGAELYG